MLNIAIIGMGQRGRATLARLRDIPMVNVTHQCDLDMDWRDVVSDRQVELVWICTPWEWHLRMATLAMECGMSGTGQGVTPDRSSLHYAGELLL